jgi:hypothetical protein
MTTILIVFVICVIIVAVALMIGGVRKRRKENEQVPMVYNGTKIFLKRKEIEKFNSSTREEKRRALGHFKASVKKGQILPVYEKGEIVGYINAKQFK